MNPLFYRRRAGLLVPVFAMRHEEDFGIGDTRAVKESLDFCGRHEFDVLQILPIHDTVGDHSPYNPISSHALAPGFVEISPHAVPGLSDDLVQKLAPANWLNQLRAGPVKHSASRGLKVQVLLAASASFHASATEELIAEFHHFVEEQSVWLKPYTLYRLLIRYYDGNPNWKDWRPDHHSPVDAEAWLGSHPERESLEQIRTGFAFIQWVAYRQWLDVRAYAEHLGVRLMGEMSFGVGRCSVDVWANPELFDLEWNMGTPPLAWFDTNKDSERWGQNWGFPPFRWENHRSTEFAWLRGRVEWERQFFHACRLDHLRGYFRAYMFPWPGGSKHTEFANLSEEDVMLRTGGRLPRFVPGPDENPVTAGMNDLQGRELIGIFKEAADGMDLVAEIMGTMPDYIDRAIHDLQIPNLTFPQLERNADRSLRPAEKMRELSLVSYGNHDHAPLALLYPRLFHEAKTAPESLHAIDLKNLLKFAKWEDEAPNQLTDELLAAFQKALFELPCRFAVLQCGDLLGIPLRFNLPGSYGPDTWAARLDFPWSGYEAVPEYARKIERVDEMIRTSGRSPERSLHSA